MKRSFFLLLCIIPLLSTCNPQPSGQNLKVMVWNILHGGYNEALPQDGKPDIIQIIKDTEADIVLMIETYGGAPMISDSLGYHHELLSSNLCIYSKYPITKKLTYPDQISTFNFGGVEIDVNGTPIRVFDTWLHYLPDTRLAPIEKSVEEILAWENAGTRDDEIKAILKAIEPLLQESDSIPVIMGGDFNSHSHLDWTPATTGMFHHGNAVVPWTVSVAMLEAGFTDTFREIHKDPVENIGTTWLSARDSAGNLNFDRKDRIDYLYSMGEKLQIEDSYHGNAPFNGPWEFKGKHYTNFPSDHGFVVTHFTLR